MTTSDLLRVLCRVCVNVFVRERYRESKCVCVCVLVRYVCVLFVCARVRESVHVREDVVVEVILY